MPHVHCHSVTQPAELHISLGWVWPSRSGTRLAGFVRAGSGTLAHHTSAFSLPNLNTVGIWIQFHLLHPINHRGISVRDYPENTPPCPTLPKLCFPWAFLLASHEHLKLRSMTQVAALLSEPTCSYRGCTTCSRMNLCLKSLPCSSLWEQSMHNAHCLHQKPRSSTASKSKPR